MRDRAGTPAPLHTRNFAAASLVFFLASLAHPMFFFFLLVMLALLVHTSALDVVTLAGGGLTGSSPGVLDGIGTAALMSYPFGIAVDSAGVVCVADTFNNKIRRIYANSSVTTLAGGNTTGSSGGSCNGIGTAALFNAPYAVLVSPSFVVFVADLGNNMIRAIYSNKTVVTVAGGGLTGTTPGSLDGIGTAALFLYPAGIARDSYNVIYIADYGNHRIRLLFPNQTVTTLAGNSAGSSNGVGMSASFKEPSGIAVNSLFVVFVVDSGNNLIRRISPAGNVTTVAGSAEGARGRAAKPGTPTSSMARAGRSMLSPTPGSSESQQ